MSSFIDKPECVICGNETPVAYHRKRDDFKQYKKTCSKECLSELKSKRGSKLYKEGVTKNGFTR